LKPDDGYILDSLAWIMHSKGQNDVALEYLRKASERVKSDPIIAEHLGDVLLVKSLKEKAAKAYKRSLQINPDNLVVKEKLEKLERELKSQPD
jgi:predicted negative regulator of RcsB-dependent stress response